MIKSQERVIISINGKEFYLPKCVFDDNFITTNVSDKFTGIHEYFIEKPKFNKYYETPDAILDQLVDYMTFDYYDDEVIFDVWHTYLSEATTMFIDKYFKNRVTLLYHCIINKSSDELEDFCLDYYDKRLLRFNNYSSKIDATIKATIPEIYDALIKKYGAHPKHGTLPLDKTCEQRNECWNTLVELAIEHGTFIPDIVMAYYVINGGDTDFVVPNISHEEFNEYCKLPIRTEKYIKQYRTKYDSDGDDDEENQ